MHTDKQADLGTQPQKQTAGARENFGHGIFMFQNNNMSGILHIHKHSCVSATARATSVREDRSV